MIQSRARGLYNAHVVGMCAVLTATFWGYLVALNVIFGYVDDLRFERYIYYNVIALIGLLINLMPGDERDLALFGNDPFRAVKVALRQTFYVAGALMFTLLLTKDRAISRLFLFSYVPLLCVFLTVANATLPIWLSKMLFSGRHTNSALLIGPSSRIPGIRRWLRYMRAFGVHVTGLLTDGRESQTFEDIPVIGEIDDVDAVLSSHPIQSVILLEFPKEDNKLHRIVDATERAGIRLVAVNHLAERFRHGIHHFQQFGLDLITVREEPLEDPLSRIVKRTFDIAVALPVVVFVLPPLCLLVAIIHRLQSPGPLFFRQERTGVGSTPFGILKFRTMRVDNDDHARQASANDDRIFPLGRLLRKTSLDEFPQFWNVLRGDMSIVGPRPHMPEHDMRFAQAMESYHIRSLVKPGLTGLAQIRGYRGEAKSREDIRRRVECDIEYIEEWSLLLDVYIILRTAVQLVVPPKTAY